MIAFLHKVLCHNFTKICIGNKDLLSSKTSCQKLPKRGSQHCQYNVLLRSYGAFSVIFINILLQNVSNIITKRCEILLQNMVATLSEKTSTLLQNAVGIIKCVSFLKKAADIIKCVDYLKTVHNTSYFITVRVVFFI